MAKARKPDTSLHLAEGLQGVVRGLVVALACLALLLPGAGMTPRTNPLPAVIAAAAAPAPRPLVRLESLQPFARADFGTETASTVVRGLADWIAGSRDNADAEFVVVDKLNAKIYVFDAAARLKGASPVLLGAAPGDDSVTGIGNRPIAEVRPEERTTPAGRFLAERGRNALGEEVVWIDYEAAVSMHRVRATDPRERRLERLASPTSDDNRISYGCINVPVPFFEAHVRPTFAARRAVVYVLPEVRSVREVFPAYTRARPQVSMKEHHD